ncbi:(2Fe-2S)-binding protein [Rapidithrix thailandica]|uniref:(2Fe-2S)-binding protein n=1 Tax=Rapidithrix thailandica TaxID=413964 RepID=A0AAW9S9E1_9BACT
MASYQLKVNGKQHTVEVDPDTPLLWVLRDNLKLYGTKYGCGIAQCGVCTVHVDGLPIRSCCVPIEKLENKEIVTIEGLSEDGSHPVQVAWKKIDVPQCGYCQSGQIMTAAALLQRKPNPSDEEISRAMKGNLCRCGTYTRIREAIHEASKHQQS